MPKANSTNNAGGRGTDGPSKHKVHSGTATPRARTVHPTHTHISEGHGKPRGKKLGIDVAKLVKGDPPPKTQTFVILAEWNWWPGQFPNRDNGHSIHDALGAPLVNCAIPNKKNLKACNLERYFFVWCAVTAWLRGPVWSTG